MGILAMDMPSGRSFLQSYSMTALFYKLHTFESKMRIVSTVLSLRLLTKPMDRPWPPEQLLLVKVLFVPELMAKQPSRMYS